MFTKEELETLYNVVNDKIHSLQAMLANLDRHERAGLGIEKVLAHYVEIERKLGRTLKYPH